MTKIIKFPFGVCSIDSLKLHIPISLVKDISPELNETRTNYEVGNETGVVHSEKILKTRSKKIDFGVYHVKACIVTRHNVHTRNENTYLELYLNTKILEKDYFKGLTKHNIRDVWNKLMRTKHFYCDFDIFMLSRVSDVDFKKDIEVPKEDFVDFTKYMRSISKERKVRDKGVFRYANGNIEWNKRETSTIANPFLKLYYKNEEAIERNEEVSGFFNEYFDMRELPSIVRGEATIKRSTEIKKFFNLESSNLCDVLNLTSEQIGNFIVHSINASILKPKVKIDKQNDKQIKGKSTIEHLAFITLNLCLKNLDMTPEKAIELISENVPNKDKRYYLKKLVQKIYEENFQNDEQVKFNITRETILAKFGFTHN